MNKNGYKILFSILKVDKKDNNVYWIENCLYLFILKFISN